MATISKRCENDHNSGKQNDDSEADPAQGCLFVVDQDRIARIPPAQSSTSVAQAEAQSDPACAGHDQIDAKEQAENIETRDRPVRQDQEAEQQRNHSGHQHQDPGRFPLHAEGKDDPHDARGYK
jgi:hypothetical protein